MKNLLILGLFSVSVSLMAQTRSGNYFYQNDFVHGDEAYRLMVQKPGDRFLFVVEKEKDKSAFEMAALSDPSVFVRLLGKAVMDLGGSDMGTISGDGGTLAISLFFDIRNAYVAGNDPASLAGTLFVNEAIPAFCRDPEEAKLEYNPASRVSRQRLKELIAEDAHRELKEEEVFAESREDREILEAFRRFEREDSIKELESKADRFLELLDELDPDYGSNCEMVFELDSVQLEFENGALHNIKAIGSINGIKEVFENFYPLSFSTKMSVNPPGNGYKLRNVIGRERLIIYTKDLLHYDYNLLSRTENYAPVDQVIMVYPGNAGTMVYKEKTSEILKAKVFTDLAGLSDDRPQGLIQLEFSKPVNLLTRTLSLGKYSSPYLLVMNRVEPYFALNKIEADDNRLNVITENGKAYATYSDLMQYRQAGLGFSLEALRLGLPSFQSVLTLGMEFNYSIVRLGLTESDTLVDNGITETLVTEKEFTDLSREIGAFMRWEINPSDKYNFALGYGANWFRFFPGERESVIPIINLRDLSGSEAEFAEHRNQLVHSFRFDATARLGTREELFFRARYHFLDKNVSQNFYQLKLGYSFYFFSHND